MGCLQESTLGDDWGAGTLASESLGEEWEECEDDEGRTFYYNVSTGVSSWQDPRILAIEDAPAEDEGHIGGASAGQVGEEWEELADEEGTPYWYNHSTGESTYDHPGHGGAGGAMQLFDSEDVAQAEAEGGGLLVHGDWEQTTDEEGHVFWYNNATGESSWTLPAT